MNEVRKNLSKEMGKVVKNYEKSGLIQRDFAREHGISLHKPKYWLKKRQQSPKVVASKGVPAFVPVDIQQTVTTQMALIRLPIGITIEMDLSSMDAGFIQTLKTC
jgi:hypothetical protein